MFAKHKKIGLVALILIILSTEFNFGNIITAYYQMSYASMIWYTVSSIMFLFPLCMIFAEYGGSIQHDDGGIYSWLVNSIGEKNAFIGTFIWLCNFVINLLTSVSGLGVSISGIINGKDTSGQWHVGPINSIEIEAILGIALIVLITAIACHGIKNVAITAVVGGIASIAFLAIFFGIAFISVIFHHGVPIQPIHGVGSFIKSPNMQFQNPIAILSFIVYAMFAYGGLEATSGMIDKLKNPHKTFPRAMMCTAVIETALYIVGIFVCGYVSNWSKTFNHRGVNLANYAFMFNDSMGISFAKAFGLSNHVGMLIGTNLTRIGSIGSSIALLGLLAVFIYTPIKSLIAGTSNDLISDRLSKFNKYGMPANAMWIQCFIIVIALILISLTGKNSQQFYLIFTDMNNISSVFPYYFIVIGFLAFKKNKHLPHPIVLFHSMTSARIAVGLVLISMTFAIIANLITPIVEHQYITAFWSFIGPVFFYVISITMYHLGIHHRAKRMIQDNMEFIKENGQLN